MPHSTEHRPTCIYNGAVSGQAKTVKFKISQNSILCIHKIHTMYTQNFFKKNFALLVYGHVHVIWPYQEAKIKSPSFYTFGLIESI